MEFNKEITRHITSVGLNKLSPADSESLQTEVRKVTIRAGPGATVSSISRAPKPEVFAAPQPYPVKFDKETTRHITNVGLNKFSPADSKSLQTEAHKAAIRARPATIVYPGDISKAPTPEVFAAPQPYPVKFDKETTRHITNVGLSKLFPADSKSLQTEVHKATRARPATIVYPGDIPRASKSRVFAAQQFDLVKFDKEITGHIASVGLHEFFPANSKSLQTAARKATILAGSGTTALASPEHLSGLARLSLYKHILFCDNSGSMNTSDRIDSMIEVTKSIAEIASYLAPDDEGLHIRFLHTTERERELYDRYGKVKTASDAAEMVRQARYNGNTMLGTILKRVVLEPYLYQHLNQNQKLEKPLLISIITDGCPYGEDVDKLKQVIIECKQKLQEKNYNPGAVNFQIHQIGNDRNAKAFLDGLRADSEIKKHVFCFSQKLDEKYQELRSNKAELEVWLYKTLAEPLLREG